MTSKYNKYKEFATDRQLEIIALLNKGKTQTQAAEVLGINRRTLERSLSNLTKRAMTRMVERDDGVTTSVQQGQMISGVSTLYDDEGNVKIQWVKSREDKTTDKYAAVKAFAEAFVEDYKGRSKPIKGPKTSNEDLLTLYGLGDPHFGMRAHMNQTGREDFNVEIAERDLKAALSISVQNAPASKTAILANMGDGLHTNTNEPFTASRGHVLDATGQMTETVRALGRAMRHGVDEMLRKHEKVIVINLRGNHDDFSATMFNLIMQAVYENDPRVTVLDNEQKNINYKWGKVLLSFLHGDKMNNQKWVNMIARDFSKLWGDTDFRYGYQGHLHHERVEEIGGMTLEIIRTLAGNDLWHTNSGYGSTRAMAAITFHKDFGRVMRFDCPIEMVRATPAVKKKNKRKK